MGHDTVPFARNRSQPAESQVRFRCRSAALNLELRYVCWQRFLRCDWTTSSRNNAIHALIRWLNQLRPQPPSLLAQPLSAWEGAYTAYLQEQGVEASYLCRGPLGKPGPRKYTHANAYLSTLRQAYRLLNEAYDETPEEEKDVWDLKKMGGRFRPCSVQHTVNFTKLSQPWS